MDYDLNILLLFIVRGKSAQISDVPLAYLQSTILKITTAFTGKFLLHQYDVDM